MSTTREPVRPRGGYRVHRCEHGFRCDSEQWLCPTCCRPGSNRAVYARKNLGPFFTARLCQLLAQSKPTSLRDLFEAATNANLGAKPSQIASTLRDLRKSGKVVGFTVSDSE